MHAVFGIRGVKLVHEVMTHLYLRAAGIYAKEKDLPWIDKDLNSLVTSYVSRKSQAMNSVSNFRKS